MIKLIRVILIISLFLSGTSGVYSQEKKSGRKHRVLIYNFTTTDDYSQIKDKDKNFQYYSIVIPETISKNLQKSKNYEIIRQKESFTIETVFKDDTQKKKYIKNLSKTGRNNKMDFIISGTYNVINNKLKTKIVIFNVKGKDIVSVENESDELGAVLLESTDLISNQMSGNIDNLDKLNIKRADNSLSLALYKPFSIMTLGLDAGYFYISGNWGKLYNNTYCYSPFIDFDITDIFSLSLKCTSVQTDSEDKKVNSYSQLRILNWSTSFNYQYKMTDTFGIVLSAGVGLAKTTIIIQPEHPFENPLAEKSSYDPACDLSVYFSYRLSAAILRAGALYKRIFYQDKPMDSATGFLGAGIHF